MAKTDKSTDTAEVTPAAATAEAPASVTPEFVLLQISPGEQVKAEVISIDGNQADLRVHTFGDPPYQDWLKVRHTGEALHRMSPGTWRREVE